MAKRYLVIGGGGFLGRTIAEKLLQRGDEVAVFDLRKTFDHPQIKFFVGDMTKLGDVEKACEGITTVIHTASPTHHANDVNFLYRVNVGGAETVVQACINKKVKQLVFTSSASVVWNGPDIKNGKEDECKYPPHHVDPYSYTKQEAEKVILKNHGKEGLLTCALRPSGIFGPGDNQFWPSLIKVAQEGKSKFQIGDGKNLFDFTYVENVAHAHILCADKLTAESGIGGQAFFITNDEPMPFWNMMKFAWGGLGYQTPRYNLPSFLLLGIAYLLSFIAKILSPVYHYEPTFSPLRVALSISTRYYSCEKAKKMMGYKPIVSMQEGMDKTLEYFKKLQSEKKPPFDKK